MAKKPKKNAGTKAAASKGTAGKKPAKKGPAAKKSAPAKKRRSVKKPAAGRPADLTALRKKIDSLDGRLIKLLNERASIAVDIGKHKRALPDGERKVYASDREALLLDRLLGLNAGPLPDRSIEAVYREIMSGSIALEQPVRIGFLGPAGSHSHDAAVKHFGSSVDFVYEDLHTIGGVFAEVGRGHVNYGIVPIENSTSGGVVDTLDAFLEHAGRVTIYTEVQIAIHHALLAACDPKDIRRIYSKPQAFQQCARWLGEQMSGRDRIESASTSRAVMQAKDENAKLTSMNMEPTTAAIASALAGEIYGLSVLFPAIEDNASNLTRFFVIGREMAGPTGDDKTSIMFTTEDRAGALVEVLGVFHAAGVNLSHIDKRPSGRETWQYTFFVDLLGHRDEPMVQAALARVEGHCKEMVVLGSYPRSKRIL